MNAAVSVEEGLVTFPWYLPKGYLWVCNPYSDWFYSHFQQQQNGQAHTPAAGLHFRSDVKLSKLNIYRISYLCLCLYIQLCVKICLLWLGLSQIFKNLKLFMSNMKQQSLCFSQFTTEARGNSVKRKIFLVLMYHHVLIVFLLFHKLLWAVLVYKVYISWGFVFEIPFGFGLQQGLCQRLSLTAQKRYEL